MRFNSVMLQSVVFLSRGNSGTAAEPIATGFFVAFEDEPIDYMYLVTARHALERGATHLRINTSDGGFRYVKLPPSGSKKWWQSEDASVDAVVTPFERTPDFVATPCGDKMMLTRKDIREYHIDIGDQLMALGLFATVYGTRKNRPIARSGMIAAMPDELIQEVAEKGEKPPLPYRAYLAEIRTTGGISGTPVWVYLGYERDAEGHPNTKGQSMILGLIRGHWPGPEGGMMGWNFSDEKGHLQTGIAAVTPIDEVATILNGADAMMFRRDKIAQHATQSGKRLVLDSVEPARGPQPELLKIDGTPEDAVKRMFKKGKPPADAR